MGCNNIKRRRLRSHYDLFMAQEAEIAGAFPCVRKELLLFGRMGIMTARAGKLPAGPRRIRFAFHRMGIGCAEGRHHVSTRCLLVMTGGAEVRKGLSEHGGMVRSVGRMAVSALAVLHRRMDRLFCEHALVMAGEAQVRRQGGQEFRVLARMGIVAGGAHAAGDRRMNRLLFERRLVVAGEAEVRNGRRELGSRLFALMVPDMARAASHFNSRMHYFPFSFIGMAVEAREFHRAQGEGSQDDDGDKNSREQLPSHNVKLYRKPTLKSTEKLEVAKHIIYCGRRKVVAINIG